jgi:hypothetical protein
MKGSNIQWNNEKELRKEEKKELEKERKKKENKMTTRGRKCKSKK